MEEVERGLAPLAPNPIFHSTERGRGCQAESEKAGEKERRRGNLGTPSQEGSFAPKCGEGGEFRFKGARSRRKSFTRGGGLARTRTVSFHNGVREQSPP